MPATSASIGGGRGERQIPFVVVRRHRARMGVAHDVGPPRVGHALHRAGHYRDAEAAGRGDRALDVVDGRLELQGTKHPMGHVSILEAHDRVAHRAEQRLDHDVAAQLVEGLHRVVVAFAHDRGRGARRPDPAARSPTTC
jgi:hypothetical protein